MNKSPLKTDQVLVQGARDAAMAGVRTDGQDGMSQGMDKLMEISGKAVEDIVAARKEKRKEGDDLAESILAEGSGLGTSWMDACDGYVRDGHARYDKASKWGRKKKQGEEIGKLNAIQAETATAKDLIASVAEAQEQKDWSNSVTEKEQGIFNAFMSNDTKKRINKDGKYEINVGTDYSDSGWMSVSEISSMVDSHKKDFTTMVDVRDQIIQAKDNGAARSKEGSHFDPDFNVEKTTAKMNNTLRNANLKSLMHDDVLENGVPWVEAVKKNPEITGMTYKSLGIDPSLANRPDQAGNESLVGQKSIDINNDGKVGGSGNPEIDKQELALLNDNDQAMIVDALTNADNEMYDEERTRGLMATYFTQSINKNYMDGYNSNAVSQLPLEHYTNQITE